jgi:hypothetical protein
MEIATTSAGERQGSVRTPGLLLCCPVCRLVPLKSGNRCARPPAGADATGSAGRCVNRTPGPSWRRSGIGQWPRWRAWRSEHLSPGCRRLWRCPGCSTTLLSREVELRCPRCGFREDADRLSNELEFEVTAPGDAPKVKAQFRGKNFRLLVSRWIFSGEPSMASSGAAPSTGFVRRQLEHVAVVIRWWRLFSSCQAASSIVAGNNPRCEPRHS